MGGSLVFARPDFPKTQDTDSAWFFHQGGPTAIARYRFSARADPYRP
jgi:hypothetical protein